MLNIVIPMAGAGSRFSRAGYQKPKPLIDVGHKTMIEIVIDNLTPATPHRFVFICQKQHLSEYPLAALLKKKSPTCEIVETDGLTEGAACTVLLASAYIDNDNPLLIANSDQYVEADIDDYLADANSPEIDGSIMTMEANDPKWSFVALNEEKLITNVVEKKVISNEATVGIYHFKRGSDFVSAARQMIASNLRVNNEFYVAPVYNLMIESGAKIKPYNIGKLGSGMHGLGVPEDLTAFLSSQLGKKVAA